MKRIFYFLVLIATCVACQDDESFSTNSGVRLDFSVDTLKLDTVFCRTPSSTYTFWVHNHNNEGIRLNQVRLRRGNQTGYRVNVDGIYLDNANGSQTNDIEVRRNDSILVFVELTPLETHQSGPVLLEDDLLFTLESGVEQKVLLQAWIWDAMKWYNPVIDKDSVIASETPIIIYGDMKVAEGVTLTLRNTTLFFHDGSGLEVYGSLQTENCTMRGDRLDDMFTYLPYDRVSGQWKGIRLYESSTDNILRQTEIRNPLYGIICDSADFDATRYRLLMQNCIVHNCDGDGLKETNAHIRLENCQLTNTLGHCLHVLGGEVEVMYCTLAQFFPFSANRGKALYFTNAPTPLNGFICEGTIVTGYEDDVILGEIRNKDFPFVSYFKNCLLRTEVNTTNPDNFEDIIWESPNDSIQGKDQFVKIDEENLDYDFHLSEKSTAAGLGCYR